MNMNLSRYLLVFAACLLMGRHAQGLSDLYIRGEINSWASPGTSMTLENGIWRTSIAASGNDASSEWLLYAQTDNQWYQGNTFFGTPSAANVNHSTGGNLQFNQVDGRYYTFTAINGGGAPNPIAVALQETTGAPVTISSFNGEVANGGFLDRAAASGDASAAGGNTVNTISVTLNTAPSSGENVYIAYSTDGFATKPTIVQAGGSGTSWAANIAAQAGGAQVSYYVLTSTFSAANLNGVAAEIDQLLRALDETRSSAQNYNIYDTGNSFHIQTQNAGGSGQQMLDGGNLSGGQAFDGTESFAYLYSGNVFQGAATVARDQSAMTLYYRVNGGGWSSQAGAFNNTAVNDKYWLSTLDLTGLSAGDLVEYYFGINYTDADTTYVYENGAGSRISGDQTYAQANPFSFDYGESEDPPPGPGGAVPEPTMLSLAMLSGMMVYSMRRRYKRLKSAAET